MSNIPITGAPPPSPAPADGSVPLRREIRDLQANYPDQWNLYILGLEAFKANNETFELSYYEIAGIHGRPYRPWGGVQGTNRGGWQGYCTHSSILFAPWHRPYLALFEQVLYRIIQDIASQFPEATRARYQQAATIFRIPYWDWAAAPPSGDKNFPNVVGTETIDVVDTTGQTVQKPNPLYSFTFHPILKNDFAPLGGAPFQEWPVTLRYPTDPTDPNATSEEDQVFAALRTQFDSLQGNVNILMNDPNYQDFAAFSNHTWENNEPGTFASLEDIHNSIHGAVGGNLGHMAEIDYAAFDPVFWLHHVNVDRLFAIWQALNPNSYTIDKRSNQNDGGTFAIREGSLELATTGLAPFYDKTGTQFWDSLGVRSTEVFNYAYPETQQWKFPSTSDYQNSVLGTVQQLYGSFGDQFAAEDAVNLMSTQAVPQAVPETVHQTTIREKAATGFAGGSQQPIAEAASVPKPAPEVPQAAPHTGFHPFRSIVGKFKGRHNNPDNNPERGGLDLEAEIGKPSLDPVPQPPYRSYTEYIVNLKAPKHILQQTYRVHVFLGEFESGLKTWHTQNALVGTFSVFGRNTTRGSDEETGCGKCKKDAEDGLIVTGTIPLTKALIHEVKEGHCPSLEKENVLPWLTENLHWRVTLADGTEIDRNEVPGLVVTVVTTEVELPAHGFPRFSGIYESHPEVTAGRPAGVATAAPAT